MKFREYEGVDFDDALLIPRYSKLESRKDVNLEVTYTFKYSPYVLEGIPIIASNMVGVGTPSIAKALAEFKLFTCLERSYGYPEDSNAFTIPTISLSTGEVYTTAPIICLDVANGYQQQFIDFVAKVRESSTAIIIAGNVATSEGVELLAEAGADIVKIGIGSGSVCTTRLKTGVGVPQLSAVEECGRMARRCGVRIISDGGCKTPGDVAKAFAAGADFVMLGGMLAGHSEGEVEAQCGYIPFHGSAYHNNEDYKTAEGKQVNLEWRGSVVNTVKDILGGLRSTCTYLGASTLEELPSKAVFMSVRRTHNTVFST